MFVGSYKLSVIDLMLYNSLLDERYYIMKSCQKGAKLETNFSLSSVRDSGATVFSSYRSSVDSLEFVILALTVYFDWSLLSRFKMAAFSD